MAATEDKLGLLHDAVADALRKRLEDEDEDGMPTISASDISNILKFLKDNNITCAPSKDNKMGELEAALEKRRKSAGPMPSELREALDDVGKMRMN